MTELRGQASLEEMLDEPINPGRPAGSSHLDAYIEAMRPLDHREHVDSDTPNMLEL